MAKEPLSRRSFLNKLWLVLGGVAVAELLVMIFAFFRPGEPRGESASESSIVTAGVVDSFEHGSVTAFVRGKFYLARLEDGGFLAMSRRCTHLSCTVPWVESDNKFICPCHSSEFDMRGEVANPPAPRALDLFPIEIQNNVIKVDTSKAERRSVFAPNQVTYPKNT
jgi:cytochrome b6-f complex iron-sulfur subunit